MTTKYGIYRSDFWGCYCLAYIIDRLTVWDDGYDTMKFDSFDDAQRFIDEHSDLLEDAKVRQIADDSSDTPDVGDLSRQYEYMNGFHG